MLQAKITKNKIISHKSAIVTIAKRRKKQREENNQGILNSCSNLNW